MENPYRILELPDGATVEEVRQARRRLAKRLHPDTGVGDAAAMAAVNRAYERIMATTHEPEWSFTLDVLPVDAFHAVEAALAELGEVLSADEPYGVEAFVAEPAPCFCTIELAPEAGGTIVTVTVQPAEEGPPPSAGDVAAAIVGSLTA
ncbi:MAG: J domain-containing protein [Actinobacteria bacterium]|nr:J domain-containing protein [Actinomycetota bacterium]